MSVEQAAEKYTKHMHAVQSGVGIQIGLDPNYADKKDLRVGIDSAHVGQAAIAALLIRKGVFSEEEYMTELAAQAENEHERMEKEVSRIMGNTDIKLH